MLFGKLLEILEKSEDRVESDCETYTRCGGCSLRHIKYEKTLEMKQNMVQSLVNKYLKEKVVVKNTIGMENPVHYRNKAQYPVGTDLNGEMQIGVFANRSHNIIPIKKCFLQDEKSEEIAKYIFRLWQKFGFNVYNEKTGKGDLRHIIIKKGFATNEYMCVLVINNNKINNKEEFIKKITTKFNEVKTIVLNVNTKNTNVILRR